MTDTEWNAWQAGWTGATGPLPDVRARARKEVRLHRLANVGFFVLVAIGLAGSIPAFTDKSSAVHGAGWMILAFCAAMAIGYAAIQRGVRASSAGNPRDAIAFLERRLRVERRTAQLVRWVYAGLCVAFVFVFPRVVEGQPDARLQMAISFPGMAILFAVSFSAPWWVARRNRRYEEELDQWRRWIDEQNL